MARTPRADANAPAKSGVGGDAFSSVLGDQRGVVGKGATRAPAAETASDLDLLAVAQSKLPPQSEELFALAARAFIGTGFALRTDVMRVLGKAAFVEDAETGDYGVGYVVAGKADGLSDRAGQDSFLAFIITDNDEDVYGFDVWLAADTPNLEEAVNALNKEMPSYFDGYGDGRDAERWPILEAEQIRERLRELLPRSRR
jgi:hypothetical protein